MNSPYFCNGGEVFQNLTRVQTWQNSFTRIEVKTDFFATLTNQGVAGVEIHVLSNGGKHAREVRSSRSFDGASVVQRREYQHSPGGIGQEDGKIKLLR